MIDSGRHFVPTFSPLARAILFSGVPGAPPLPHAPGEWDRELGWIVEWELARHAVKVAHDGDVRLSPQTRATLASAARREAVHTLSLDADAVAILRTLASADIPALLLKGPIMALRDPRLTLRSYADVDVMIHPSSLGRATEVLNDIGFHEPVVDWDPRANFRYRFRHAVPFERDGIALDLHHVLPPIIFGRRLGFDRLWADSTIFRLGDFDARGLSPSHAAVAAALHILSSRGGSWPKPWRDAAILLSSVANVRELAEEIHRLKLAGPLECVTGALQRGFGLEVPLRDHLARRRTGGDRMRLWAMSARRPWIDHQFSEIVMLPAGLAFGFARAFAAPESAFLHARYPELAGRSLLRARLAWWKSSSTRLLAVARQRPLELRLPGPDRHHEATDGAPRHGDVAL